jgi:DNA-binding Xre family transcriptional regulator
MKYCYDKLWKLLIDKKMIKKDLKTAAGITSSTMAKMGKEQAVSLEVLGRICKALSCNIDNVLEIKY